MISNGETIRPKTQLLVSAFPDPDLSHDNGKYIALDDDRHRQILAWVRQNAE
jgi:hypothetical protein